MKPKAEADVRDRPWGDPFSDFDPLAPLIPPEGVPEQLGYVSRRAQHLLGNRSINEIDAGLDTLTWILQRAGSDIGSWNRSESELEPQEFFLIDPHPIKASINEYDHPARGYYEDTDFDRLCDCIDQYDISDQPDFLNAKKSDFFAILCLTFISDVLRLTKVLKTIDDHPMVYSPQIKVDEYYFAAIQSIDYAERCLALDAAEPRALKKRGRMGGLVRTADFTHLKIDYLRQYIEVYANKDISNRQAGIDLYEQYKNLQARWNKLSGNEGDSIDRGEQVGRWIGQYKNGHIKIPPE